MTSTTSRTLQPAPEAPPGVHPTSLKWAAIVPLAAVIMLGLFIGINALFPDGKQAANIIPKIEKVTGLHTNSVPAFTHYVVNAIPPANIVNSVYVPQEVSFVGEIYTGGQASSYDRSLAYSSPVSEGALYSYFHTVMTAAGWKIFSIAAPAGSKGIQLLAQKAGDDGFYWEEGVTIHLTRFTAGAKQTTYFTVRLYQAAEE